MACSGEAQSGQVEADQYQHAGKAWCPVRSFCAKVSMWKYLWPEVPVLKSEASGSDYSVRRRMAALP